MYNKLTNVISESGIWSGTRKESHAFLLSPSVYQITEVQRQELQTLGVAIYDCLLGLSHIAVIAYDSSLNYGGAWLLARRVFSTGVPKAYQELQGINIRHIPKLLKVDLMVDQDGNFKIAEIDGHNKHGLGYSTLGLRFREALYPEAKALPGTVQVLSGEMKRLGHNEIKLLYADQERFYVPEFEVARQEFTKHGINCSIISEMEIDDTFLGSGMFLDLPFLYHKKELYDTIVSSYKNRQVDFIIPPKPFLGAKGVLALIRNDGRNEHLESLLSSFIKKSSLELLRKYIPETFLVGKQAETIDSIKERLSHKRFVLKESISSGMKGTVFSDEECFDSVLTRACTTNMNWILQEEVVNQPQTFSWFENEGINKPKIQTTDDWFMRVTTQYINRQLGDVIVTACRGKAVHGGKKCLQLGTIVL
ncbi:MAG: hypothetical protein K9L98_03105 [Candidatus Pacebacteria bacterium]|nr:hypothetical protein [Candidatus Paceibacterota bacterium]MCF7862971.1 hypothetical protein [Candidatus Paceibacterota bacterium]